MAYEDVAKHSMLADLTGQTSPAHVITSLSLHSGDPATSANQVGSRISVTDADFDAPGATTAGEVELNNDKTFSDLPADQTVATFGVWEEAGPTLLGGGSLSGDTQANSNGEYILKAGTSLDLNS